MEEERERGNSVGVDEEKWVYDSSVDHKGRVPLRASTGVWKASLFIIVIEFSERLSYFGIVASLIIYLTSVIHQDLKTAAKSSNYWTGVTTVMPLLGGFLADAYLGRFSTVLASSIVYLLGLILLTMSRLVPALKPCDASNCQEPRKIHEVIFFLAIYLISIGTGGHKPSLQSFGADQFDNDHHQERIKKMSFFNWWNFGLCSGLLLGVTVIVYIQDHVSWAVADIVLTAVMASSIVVFCTGRLFYRYRKPMGSPLTPLLHVLVAAISKRKLVYPTNTAELYEVSKTENNERLLCHTHKLKFLDKAAIVEDKKYSEFEATKPLETCNCTMLDRKIGRSFLIPPASLYALAAIGMIISVLLYEKVLLPFLRKATGNERGVKILQRIGFGMVFSVVTMIVAALVERKRLGLVEKNPLRGSTTMSVFWLAPQFLIIGFGDGFALVGLQEYFYDQVPYSMRSLGIAFYLSVIGVANFISSLLITNCGSCNREYGEEYSYKNEQGRGAVAVVDCYEGGDGVGTMA
ncbi:major facilitator superfamily protein [Actinidia rufa]|uniref:Major facilitator superfamily protein n=1 Tax=Actinidia rufa TaxID=165716 RepID=A0A7J0F5L3_9ERIC|nr:major facilitator superfamily protein [Actinidia rufa]